MPDQLTTSEWFFMQPRSVRKDILAILHECRSQVVRPERKTNLKNLIDHLENDHERAKSV